MELKPKPGWPELQEALDNIFVDKIVSFLLQETDEIVFRAILQFLRSNSSPISSTSQKLQALRNSLQGRTDSQGNFITRSDLDELFRAVASIYEEKQETLKYLRGAIVELLTTKLVNSRCRNGECYNNHGFFDKEDGYESPQIDVAVLSKIADQIEGYTCKINPYRFTLDDRDNLLNLSQYAQKKGFRTHLGAVSFDRSEITLQQLRNMRCESAINAYGADNIKELRKNPFGEMG